MKFRVLFALLFGLVSCAERGANGGGEEGPITLRIDPGVIVEPELKIDGWVDSVRFVRLETDERCMVGQISRLLFVDSTIVAVDRKAGTLPVFDGEGKYLRTIDRRGKAPGEYTRITCALYDSIRQRIAVYDGAMRKLLFYRPDGTFIREIPDFCERAVIRDLIDLPDGSFLCYTPDAVVGQPGYDDRYVGLWKVDENGRFVANLLRYHTVYPVPLTRYGAYLARLDGDRIGLADGVTGDIYHIERDSLAKYIAYDIVGPKITDFPGRQAVPESEFVYVGPMWAEQKGDYVYSFWSDGRNLFPVLYSGRDDRLTVAERPDRRYVVGQHVPNNRNRVMTLVVTGEDVLLQQSFSYPEEIGRVVRQQVEGMTEEQIAEMNPLVEIWYLKS